MNGQWQASIRSKKFFLVTCSDSKTTISGKSAFYRWIFWDPWAEKLRLLEKKKQEFWMTRTFQGPRKSSLLAQSESFRGGDTLQGFIFHGYKKCSLGMPGSGFLQVFSRPQNLEKLSLEELHQRKHDLKQEDQLRRAGRFFSMRYKTYEATRCIYTVVCCNHLTSSWDLGPSSSTLRLTYIHLSNLAHLTMSLRASVNISEEMTQCSRILPP